MGRRWGEDGAKKCSRAWLEDRDDTKSALSMPSLDRRAGAATGGEWQGLGPPNWLVGSLPEIDLCRRRSRARGGSIERGRLAMPGPRRHDRTMTAGKPGPLRHDRTMTASDAGPAEALFGTPISEAGQEDAGEGPRRTIGR
ncbi:hypothetical protein THAOC_30950 [Thalassiosira oceanica]|uniref:Uncharacterized protein n=1 Tax=Thalassiosira oceanica TaxID=159749 RepID=K0RCY7_THAOC|nr:hypothetical protein THAOC_30950 [Thalassiosira oceanica]|eukprot:EJK50114.1 hypothetical protein THAOC_30950 [Thalassiosira oceanica]